MKAVIRVTNQSRGLYAAEIDGRGGYVIFELLDSSEPEVGDVISHPDFDSLGGETIHSVSQSCDIDVSIVDVCGARMVRPRLFGS